MSRAGQRKTQYLELIESETYNVLSHRTAPTPKYISDSIMSCKGPGQHQAPSQHTHTHTHAYTENPNQRPRSLRCSANTQTAAHERVRVCQGSSRVGWRGARDGLINPRAALEKALLPGLISLPIWPDAQVTSLRLLAVRCVLFGSHSYHPSLPPTLHTLQAMDMVLGHGLES